MKKLLSLLIGLSIVSSLFAGGLVTNTNLSAMFTRMMARDATLGIDAVYYNPAGLTRLTDGFHISLSNQTISQTQSIGNNYMYLSDPTYVYEGIVKAPLFPSFYAVYKTGKLAFSFGFNPIGGGGGAEFSNGLPSFEMMVADLVPGLQAQLLPLDQLIEAATGTNFGFSNITGYNSSIYFEGSSIYFGYQANVSYAVSDLISLAIGARYVTAKNTYKGYVKDVTIVAPEFPGLAINPTPGDYLRFLAAMPFIGAGSETGQQMIGTANALDEQTNLEADVIRSGSGLTPIVSLNFASPNEKINLAVKYEFKTTLELATTVNDGKDAGGLFGNEAAVVADMPAQLSVGATMKPVDRLLISTGLHYYFDKNNDYDGSFVSDIDMIDKNFIEYALGLELGLTKNVSISGGWLMTQTGVNDLYQNDQRFSLNTNTFGGGFGINLLPGLNIDLGASITMYEDGSRDFNYMLGNNSIPVTETYDKSVWLIAAGISYSFGN